MNSHQMQNAVHSFCDLYGGRVEEFQPPLEMTAVEDGRIVVTETAAGECRVSVVDLPEEAGAQLEAGKRGLRLELCPGGYLLRPA